MVGAPLLSAQAALRTGAGLVTIASDAEVIDKLERRVEEIMTFRIAAEVSAAVAALKVFMTKRKVSVLVIGPGQKPESSPLVRKLLQGWYLPTVVDGGALAAFRGHRSLFKEIAAKNHDVILTPHTGEYKKMTGDALPSDGAANPQLKHMAEHFAVNNGVTLVLKDHRTLVAHPDGKVYENQNGNPGMATAGTGDVLSGVIAGLLAQGADTVQATERGVYLHGSAGDIAAEIKTQPSMTASDIIECIPNALRQIEIER